MIEISIMSNTAKIIAPTLMITFALSGCELSIHSAKDQIFSSESKTLCLSEFYQNTPPIFTNTKLENKSYPLCYNGFALNYSGLSKTPLWVAEKLTPQRLSVKIPREDSFHEEDRVPEADRATLADYRSSGYDRGHMAPNADMNNKNAQHDSFSLANMVPQTPENNQHIWREIEETTRAMVTKYKLEAYVVTGPAYMNKTVKTTKKGSKVLVPSHVYKVVYFPQTRMMSAYFAPNDKSKSAKIISVCDLEEKIGINIFPNIDENTKRQIYKFQMKASKVKANQAPVYFQTDYTSKCSNNISNSDIEKVRNQFIVGYNYATGRVDNAAVVDSATSSQTGASNTSQIDTNDLLVKVIHLIKQL